MERRTGALTRGVAVMGLTLAVGLGVAIAPAWAADLTVTMRLAEAEWQVIRQEVLPPFEQVCGCRVRAIDVPPEALTQRLKAMRSAGRTEIDLFAQDNMRLQELVDAGLVQALTPAEAAMDPAILPTLAAEGVIAGRRYFLPFRPNVQIVYYNTKKFDAYGLTPPRTWDALLAVGQTFKEKEGIGRVLFQAVGGAPTVTQLYEWIVSAGGDPFDFASPGAQATFRFLHRLADLLIILDFQGGQHFECKEGQQMVGCAKEQSGHPGLVQPICQLSQDHHKIPRLKNLRIPLANSWKAFGSSCDSLTCMIGYSQPEWRRQAQVNAPMESA